jgi:hypothetical protein
MHEGDKENIVLYIPVGPACPLNRLYVERLKHSFQNGILPPDFSGVGEEHKFVDRAGMDDLSEEGKKVMGY